MSIDLLLLFFFVLRFFLSLSDSEESPEESELEESDLCLFFLAAMSLRSFSLLSSPSEESPLPFPVDEPEPDEELEESFFFRFRFLFSSAEEESLFSLRGGALSFSSSDESCRSLALAFGVVSGESGSF